MKLLETFGIVKTFDLSSQPEWLTYKFPADFSFIDYFISSPRFNEKSNSEDIMSTSYIDGVFGLLPPQVKSRYEQETQQQAAKAKAPTSTSTAELIRPKIENLFFDMKYSLQALEKSGRVSADRLQVDSAE